MAIPILFALFCAALIGGLLWARKKGFFSSTAAGAPSTVPPAAGAPAPAGTTPSTRWRWVGLSLLGLGLISLSIGLKWGDWSADGFLVSIIETFIIGQFSWFIWLTSGIVAFGFIAAHTERGSKTELTRVARWVYRFGVVSFLMSGTTAFFQVYDVEDPIKPLLEAVSECAHNRNKCLERVPDAEDVRDSLKRLGEGVSGLINGGESGGREESPPDPNRVRLRTLEVPEGQWGTFNISYNGTGRKVIVSSGRTRVTFHNPTVPVCYKQIGSYEWVVRSPTGQRGQVRMTTTKLDRPSRPTVGAGNCISP